MIFGRDEQRSAIVGPDPVVTRNDDGTLSIDWHTSNGEPPSLPILCSPELLRMMVDQYNENVAEPDENPKCACDYCVARPLGDS